MLIQEQKNRKTMKVKIQSIKFDVKEQLNKHIEKKVRKIEKIYDKISHLDIYLKVEKPETASNKTVEIKATAPNAEFFASKTYNTFEEAIDSGVEAIERQILKHKEKILKK